MKLLSQNNLLFFIILVNFFYSCNRKERSWITCETILNDTIIINKDHAHGTWLIQDSLVLTTGCHPFDSSLCQEIPLRIKPIISFHGEHICSLVDLYPPFKIIKPNKSDSIVVFYQNKIYYFRLPGHLCNF